jgi:poly(3-hydroxybutyrate) depolymerase
MPTSFHHSLNRRQLLLGAAATTAVGCGPSAIEREPAGTHELTDRIRGYARSSTMIIPKDLQGLAPVLLGLHDMGSDPASFYAESGWQAECARRGWISVYPRFRRDDYRADNDFYVHLIRRVTALAGGDQSRVYVVGHGGGGRRAYALAASHSGMLAAAGAAAAPIRFSANGYGHQDPIGPTLSLIHIHGAVDKTVPVEGLVIPEDEDKTRTIASVSEGLAPWIAHIGAQPTAVSSPPIPGFTGTRWAGGKHAVEQWIQSDHGHTWNPAWTPMFADFFAAAPERIFA